MNKLKIFLMALVIRTIGRLSTGIEMSFKYGFTSGMMLDYIYENKAHGKFIIGKILDRMFLDNVGWQAIRQRKENLKSYIKESIARNRKNGARTVILDIASGPARYIIEVLGETGQDDAYVICQDIDSRWLEYGRRRAEKAGLKNIRFEKGDAFNLEMLSGVSPKPDIVVSSGFYDWITNDELVKKSLQYAYRILEDKGLVIFTNQASHLQMELVSRAFLDFNQEPLRMKTRPAELINGWARDAGFKNLQTVLDKWGLYSVTKGEK